MKISYIIYNYISQVWQCLLRSWKKLREASINPIHHNKAHPPKAAIPGSYAYSCKWVNDRIWESLFFLTSYWQFITWSSLHTSQFLSSRSWKLGLYSLSSTQQTKRAKLLLTQNTWNIKYAQELSFYWIFQHMFSSMMIQKRYSWRVRTASPGVRILVLKSLLCNL